MSKRLPTRLFAAANAGLGLFHLFFGFVQPVYNGLSYEGYFFLMIAALFFTIAVGFVLNNRWIVLLASIPIALTSCTLAFLIAGGGWIWGPPRSDQMYLFIVVSLLIATLEISGILLTFRYSRKERASTGTPAP